MKLFLKSILFVLCIVASAQQRAVIDLDSKVTFQKMRGWEATVAYQLIENPCFPLFKEKLLDEAVNILGLNRVRLEIRSGSENPRDAWAERRDKKLHQQLWRCLRYATVNDDNDPFHINWDGFHFTELDTVIENLVLPIRKRVEANGEKLFLNVNYVAFYAQLQEPTCPAGLQYVHKDPMEYAEFVLAAYLHMKQKYGLVPDAWEIHLEPDNTPDWRGNLIGQAIVQSAKRLRENGFQPAFIAPSTTAMDNAVPYFDEMIQVPGVLDSLAEFSYHRYRGVSDANLKQIGERAIQHKVSTAMLEHIRSGYEDLHKDLTIARNSAWQQYELADIGSEPNNAIREWVDSAITAPLRLASKTGDPKTMDQAIASAGTAVFNRLHYGPEGGTAYYTIETRDPQHPEVVINSRTKFLRQYFKYARRDAVRIGATSSATPLEPIAMINPGGGYVVIVKAGDGMEFTIRGLPDGLYGIHYTTAARYDFSLPDVSISRRKALATGLPAAGVLTVYAKPAKRP